MLAHEKPKEAESPHRYLKHMRRPRLVLTLLTAAGVAMACSRTPPAPRPPQPGHYLYVADAPTGTIAGYRLNEETGALAATPDRVPLDRRGGTAIAAVHASERFIYIADGLQIQLRALDKDGVPAKAVTSYYDVAAGDLAITGEGRKLFAFAASHRTFSLFDVNPATAELVEVAGSPVTVDESTIAARPHPNGQLFFALSAGGASSRMQVWVRTPDSIAPVVGSPFTLAADAVSFAISPDGRYLLVAHKALAAAVYAIDDAGGIHPVAGSPFAVPDEPLMLTVDPGGALAYLAYARASLDVFTLGPDGSLSRRSSAARAGRVSRLIAIAVPDPPIAVASLPAPDSAELLPIVTAERPALN
jgi:hypothetical protein